MPKHISDKDLYPIETLLADRPDGWRIGEIEKALVGQGLSFNRRTLQRRLARLEKAERILIAGAGRATRYLPIVSAKKSTETNDGIFLSIDAQEVQNRVSRPLSARKPISYQREFIDSYQPNATWYLPAAIRNHLKSDKKLCKRCYQDVEIFLDYIDALRNGGLELIDSINYRIFRDLLSSVQAGIIGLPHDLIHINLCRDLKIDHIATQDSDFDNVPGFTVWKPRVN